MHVLRVAVISACLCGAVGREAVRLWAASEHGTQPQDVTAQDPDWEQALRLGEACWRRRDWLAAEVPLRYVVEATGGLDFGSTATAPRSISAANRRLRCRALHLLADVYRGLGRRTDALACAVAYHAELEAVEPRGDDVQQLRLRQTLAVAGDYAALGLTAETRDLLQQVLAGRWGSCKPLPRLEVLVQLAELERSLGHATEARAQWTAAETLASGLWTHARQHLRPDERDRLRQRLIQCYEALGKTEAAEAELLAWERSWAHDGRKTPPPPRDPGRQRLREARACLAAEARAQGQLRRAEQLLRSALADPTASLAPCEQARLMCALAEVLDAAGATAESADLRWRAMHVYARRV